MPEIVDIVIDGAKEEVQNVKNFVQTPMGPFAALDSVVVTARNVVFKSLRSVGVDRPLLGQRLAPQSGTRIKQLRERIRLR